MSGPGAIRTVIADDEAPGRRTLRVLLAADPEIAVVAECTSGPETVAVLRAQQPELVFLDVEMPGATGFEVLEALRGEASPRVVFATAHAEHALRAFDVAAVDYVLKPFDDERFARAVERAKEAVRERQALVLAQRLGALVGRPEPAAESERPLERIAVRDRGNVHLVPVEQIDWIGAQDYYAELHAGAQSYLVREALSSLERRLDRRRFARIHRASIVNVTRVRTLEPETHGEWTVVLRDGQRLRLSRRYRDSLDALLGK
jgi:two-component system, LytTR family, response regulator